MNRRQRRNTVQRDDSAGKGDDKFTPGDALSDAGDILAAALGAILIGLAVVFPLGAIIAIVWVATTGLRQRRRERALDSEPRPGLGPDPNDR